MNKIIQGDCIEVVKTFEENSIDLICTDPPYGYSFMGKNWDKAVPSVETWKECLRVLKPGAFCFVMSAPRQDVLNQMIVRLTEAGFEMSFTSIYWAYASGFPKAMNVSKAVDKRLGFERKGRIRTDGKATNSGSGVYQMNDGNDQSMKREFEDGDPVSEEAKTLNGSYGGFQPKPAVEVIIVAMKPLSEKTYVDQALKNGKGVTWLDNGRIPTMEEINYGTMPDLRDVGRQSKEKIGIDKLSFNQGIKAQRKEYIPNTFGRFPANLLVSNDVFDADSRFFSLDAWAKTFPFLIVPKASKGEKNEGLDNFEIKKPNYHEYRPNAPTTKGGDTPYAGTNRNGTMRNAHPTVKPLKLMSYLITLGSRPGDVVLDPFVGSGTTCLAAKKLDRKYIGIEREKEYVDIAEARLKQDDLFTINKK